MSSEWESLYGEVVWAKCPPFNWWPCYVYDPDKIPDTSEEVRKKASKLNGKQYAVYFYGDTSYSFTVPKNIVPYNEESKAKFAQNPPKRYATQFASGIEIADIEVALEKSKRVNFHLQGTGAINSSDSTVETKKRGRPKKTDTKVGDDELYFVEPGQNKKKSTKRSNDEANGDDEDEEKQSEAGNGTAAAPSKVSAKVGRKSKPGQPKRARGRPRLHPRPEDREVEDDREKEEEEVSTSNSSQDEAEEEEEEEASADEEEEEEVIVKPSAKKRKTGGESAGTGTGTSSSTSRTKHLGSLAVGNNSASASVSAGGSGGNSSSAFADESPVDRLVRFGKILAICTAAPADDEDLEAANSSSSGGHQRDIARAVKLLDKLSSVEVSSAELVKSGIGKIITELRRSQDVDISSRAQTLRAKWKAIVQNEGPSPRSGASTTSVVPISSGNNKKASSGTDGGLSSGAAGSNNKEASGVVPASAAPVPVSVAASALSTSGIASLSLTLTPAQSQARARAVRLLREAASASAASAAAAGHAAAAAAATGAGSGEDTFSNNSNANMNSGELAFAAEKLAMEVLGGPAQPRYLEFITRLAAKLKNGSVSIPSSDALQSYLTGFEFVSVGGL